MDIRSMLRDERASRRIKHPHLTYSTTGTLICVVCQVQIKTEALWNKHLSSPQHTKNAQRTRDNASAKSAPNSIPQEVPTSSSSSSKKRKADDESSDEDSRKRTKGGQQISSIDDSPQTTRENGKPRTESDIPEIFTPESDPTTNHTPSHPPQQDTAPPKVDPPNQNHTVDEDEWAAFQRDVASPPPENSALTAAADISAAPMTAAELAAQSREQASKQAKEKMEAEVEGEKEDAARKLEEEFEDMAELEDRVKRLRERRERLRVAKAEGGEGEGPVDEEEGRPPDRVVVKENGYGSDDASSDEEEDVWGGWGR
ncbi:MAG: hypothetical protein Q9219_000957 [cf. Caloplaca sp. 3 TL-2023]